MSELFRDTVVGQCFRLLIGRTILQYPEERYPSIWQKYLNVDKSANMVIHGSTSSSQAEEKQRLEGGSSSSQITPAAETATEEEKERLASGNVADQTTNSAEQSYPLHTRRMSDQATLHQQLPASTGGEEIDLVNNLSVIRIDPEIGRDAHIVDWYGPDDPENPQHWSTVKKIWVTFEICLLTFSVYIGSAIYTPSILGVSETFGVSHVAATLGLTLFVLGYATGPMLFSPMSEVPQIGRAPVYIGTLALFVVLQVPTALAANFGMLLAFRFITGFVGSPSLATGGATIADMFSPAKRTYGIAVWGMGAVSGPVLGWC